MLFSVLVLLSNAIAIYLLIAPNNIFFFVIKTKGKPTVSCFQEDVLQTFRQPTRLDIFMVSSKPAAVVSEFIHRHEAVLEVIISYSW